MSASDVSVFEPYWLRFTTLFRDIEPTLFADDSRLIKFKENLEQLYKALLAYNENVNLTRITDPEGFLFRHVLDSLTLLPYFPANSKVLDLGSGGGFPVLPLMLARPDLQLVAVESVGKKCHFIEQMAQTFNASNRLAVLQNRAEVLGQDAEYRGQFDRVTARAVASLNVLLEWTIPFLKEKGQLLALKGGQSHQDEISRSQKALHILGSRLLTAEAFVSKELSYSALVVIEKVKPTDLQYPRPTPKIKKNPL